MDVWQKVLYDSCKGVVDQTADSSLHTVTVSIGSHEAYVIMKALEDQQRFLNPQHILEYDKDGNLHQFLPT